MNFLQEVKASIVEGPREPWIEDMCRGRKILHVGCADAGLSVEGSLHCKLRACAVELHGCDVDAEALGAMASILPGTYFSSLQSVVDAGQRYDLVIAPETLEHVDNAGLFLRELFAVPSSDYLITVPDARVIKGSRYDEQSGTWFEGVHPDHRAWYSPYTLYKNVEPFLASRAFAIYILESCGMVALRVTGN